MNDKIDQILEEVSMIRMLLEFSFKSKIVEEIIEIATTPERKKIWSLLDGQLNTEELANECQISRRAVQIFIKDLSERNLISYNKKRYPKRKFDFIPRYWRI